MSNSAIKINTQVANTIEDIFKILHKLMDEKREYIKDKEFLRTMKDKNINPLFLSMESVAAKRLVQEMDRIGIPYMQFKVKGSSKDILLIRPDDHKRVQDLENGIRIHAGLEIDTKEELDRALCLTDDKAKEYIVERLTEYEAYRITEWASKANDRFTVVVQEKEDGSFLIASHEKNKERINEYVVSAILENENKSKEMVTIKEGKHYLQQQKKEFSAAIDEIRDTNTTKPAYIFSLTEPEKYIRIQENGFEVIDKGIVTHFMNMAQNPELYPDILKLIGNSIDTPIFKLASEVKEIGGLKKCLEDAMSYIPGSITPKNYPIDAAFKKWVNQSVNTKNGYVFNNTNIISSLNIEAFSQAYLRNNPNDYEKMKPKIPYFNMQLEALQHRLENILVREEKPVLSFEDILAKNGIDVALHEEFYSQVEVDRINKGVYINDTVNDNINHQSTEDKEYTSTYNNEHIPKSQDKPHMHESEVTI